MCSSRALKDWSRTTLDKLFNDFACRFPLSPLVALIYQWLAIQCSNPPRHRMYHNIASEVLDKHKDVHSPARWTSNLSHPPQQSYYIHISSGSRPPSAKLCAPYNTTMKKISLRRRYTQPPSCVDTRPAASRAALTCPGPYHGSHLPYTTSKTLVRNINMFRPICPPASISLFALHPTSSSPSGA